MTPERLDSLLRMYMPVSAHEEARRFGQAVAREAWREEREQLMNVLAALVAAVSLLEHGGKKAAPSDKMFAQMLEDYNDAMTRARTHTRLGGRMMSEEIENVSTLNETLREASGKGDDEPTT